MYVIFEYENCNGELHQNLHHDDSKVIIPSKLQDQAQKLMLKPKYSRKSRYYQVLRQNSSLFYVQKWLLKIVSQTLIDDSHGTIPGRYLVNSCTESKEVQSNRELGTRGLPTTRVERFSGSLKRR